MIKNIKIPEERLPVLIGKNGMTKRSIQRKTKTKIDASEEEVIIEGESIGVLDAESIIKAIGRGFSPEHARLLLDEENTLVVIDLPKGEKTQKRLK